MPQRSQFLSAIALLCVLAVLFAAAVPGNSAILLALLVSCVLTIAPAVVRLERRSVVKHHLQLDPAHGSSALRAPPRS